MSSTRTSGGHIRRRALFCTEHHRQSEARRARRRMWTALLGVGVRERLMFYIKSSSTLHRVDAWSWAQ